ncbi:hypothetical protein C7H19_08750 [Aphanothece hegewaldii CCALA 016]|uniref:DUF2029 domain-containing protein n=1 Tax=Aphanothece hegewaldii CCALA 016 TaxID=2107694 RepID=A0A2T1LZ17_9CHRO|nr:glycosyltransferase family 87 protein [Aphanothece hegewaldii]PSF37633.1 hypothetical protein C7H19_08750 [Aphanothece hegewaldii CCALA 016]
MSNKLFINLFNAKKEKVLWFFSFLLMGLSIVYLIKGFYHLIFVNDIESAKDLLARWLEQQYIYRGQYPYYARPGTPNVIKELGPVLSGGYPPWAFFTGFIFFPNFSWPVTRIYFAFLNVISLIVLAVFSYSITAPKNKAQAFFSVASSLAISTACTTLKVGQYGLIINALLIGAFWLYQNKKYIWTGLFLGLALAKPNISAFYFLIFLARRQFKVIVMFFSFIIVEIFLILFITRMQPVNIFNNFIQQLNYFVLKGTSLLNLLSFNQNIPPNLLVFLLGGVSFISLLMVFYLFRNVSLLTLFAISCLIARLVTYHRTYDDVMLVFLLLAFLKITYRNPQTTTIVIFIVLGLSLWLPAGMTPLLYPYWTIFQFIIWVIALVYLLIDEVKTNQKINNF